jgi:hypothetical protein
LNGLAADGRSAGGGRGTKAIAAAIMYQITTTTTNNPHHTVGCGCGPDTSSPQVTCTRDCSRRHAQSLSLLLLLFWLCCCRCGVAVTVAVAVSDRSKRHARVLRRARAPAARPRPCSALANALVKLIDGCPIAWPVRLACVRTSWHTIGTIGIVNTGDMHRVSTDARTYSRTMLQGRLAASSVSVNSFLHCMSVVSIEQLAAAVRNHSPPRSFGVFVRGLMLAG